MQGKGFKTNTLRSTFERKCKIELNSGSVSIVRHLPAPCLITPALSAASSSAVHFCFGAPINRSPEPFWKTVKVSTSYAKIDNQNSYSIQLQTTLKNQDFCIVSVKFSKTIVPINKGKRDETDHIYKEQQI